MTISLSSGDARADERRHDADRRPAGPGRDAARRAETAGSRPPAGGGGPEMTVPDARNARRRAAAPTAVKQAPDEARGRTPTRGAEVAPRARRSPRPARAGRASACRPAAAPGPASSSTSAISAVRTTSMLMVQRIRANWNPQAEKSRAWPVVKFTIQRDGTADGRSRSTSRAAMPPLDLAGAARAGRHAAAAAAAGGVSQSDADRPPHFPVHTMTSNDTDAARSRS